MNEYQATFSNINENKWKEQGMAKTDDEIL